MLRRLIELIVFFVLFLPGPDLSVVELHGVISGQRHTQAFVKKLLQWVL